MGDEAKAIVVIPGKITTTGPSLIKMAEYEGAAGKYEIFGIDDRTGKPGPLAETAVWRLFVAKTPTGQTGLMKVNRPENETSYYALDREARILRTLQHIASDIDAETEGSNKPFHGANLPIVLEILEPEPEKLVVFLGYHPSITTYRQLIPLSLVTGSQRVDLQTATWILGKLLKTLSFVHYLGFSVGLADASNVFIEKDVHGVLVLDLSSGNEDATEAEQKAEVAAAAKIIWNAVGGTDAAEPPRDTAILSAEHHAEYVAVLRRIMNGETEGATEEHALIYSSDTGLADRVWPKVPNADGSGLKRQFHPFATYPR